MVGRRAHDFVACTSRRSGSGCWVWVREGKRSGSGGARSATTWRRSTPVDAGGGVARRGAAQVLDAFFVGRALADVLNERVGSAVGELLSDLAKKDAERRKEMKEIQEEVSFFSSTARSGAWQTKVARL